MAKLADLNKVAADFKTVADFSMVYIAEAHPSNGWSFASNPYKFQQHLTMEDRKSAAESMLLPENRLAASLYIDNMADDAGRQFGASPARFYIIEGGYIKYASQMGPMGFMVDDVREWLNQYVTKQTLKDYCETKSA